jgi:cell division septation protein DedD
MKGINLFIFRPVTRRYSMSVEKHGSSKTDVMIKLILVLFISLLSFSVGTYVGKKFSDNQQKVAHYESGGSAEGAERSVASVEEHASATEPKEDEHGEKIAGQGEAANHGDGHGEKSATVPSDEEVRKLAAEFVSDEPTKKEEAHADPHAKPVHAKSDEHAAEAPAHGEAKAPKADQHAKAALPSSVADRLADGHAPLPEPKKVEKRAPAELPKQVASSPIGKYTVQVAALTTEDEAKNMASDMTKRGLEAFYLEAKVKNKTYYRVNVRLFESEKAAAQYRKELMAKEKLSSALVQKITN